MIRVVAITAYTPAYAAHADELVASARACGQQIRAVAVHPAIDPRWAPGLDQRGRARLAWLAACAAKPRILAEARTCRHLAWVDADALLARRLVVPLEFDFDAYVAAVAYRRDGDGHLVRAPIAAALEDDAVEVASGVVMASVRTRATTEWLDDWRRRAWVAARDHAQTGQNERAAWDQTALRDSLRAAAADGVRVLDLDPGHVCIPDLATWRVADGHEPIVRHLRGSQSVAQPEQVDVCGEPSTEERVLLRCEGAGLTLVSRDATREEIGEAVGRVVYVNEHRGRCCDLLLTSGWDDEDLEPGHDVACLRTVRDANDVAVWRSGPERRATAARSWFDRARALKRRTLGVSCPGPSTGLAAAVMCVESGLSPGIDVRLAGFTGRTRDHGDERAVFAALGFDVTEERIQ